MLKLCALSKPKRKRTAHCKSLVRENTDHPVPQHSTAHVGTRFDCWTEWKDCNKFGTNVIEVTPVKGQLDIKMTASQIQ